MSSPDDDLRALLPSRHRPALAAVIGRRLLDVERLFSLDAAQFSDGGRRAPATFFRRNVGPTRFVFEGGGALAFTDWPSQRSVVVLPGAFEPDVGQQLHRLSESSDPLRRALGRTCHDVRVWTLADDAGAGEALECAVSVALDAEELFYCTWLHGELDADFLLPSDEVPRARVVACLSASTGPSLVDPGVARRQRVERAARRFHPDDRRQASHAALLKEYLRRSALWAEALDRRGDWPFLDVARALFPGLAAPTLQLPRLGAVYAAQLPAAVGFAQVADTSRVSGFGLPDPYEPLLRLLERGATLTTEHGMLFAGTAGMPRAPFPEGVSRWAEGPLDDAALDARDAAVTRESG